LYTSLYSGPAGGTGPAVGPLVARPTVARPTVGLLVAGLAVAGPAVVGPAGGTGPAVWACVLASSGGPWPGPGGGGRAATGPWRPDCG